MGHKNAVVVKQSLAYIIFVARKKIMLAQNHVMQVLYKYKKFP